MHYTSALLPLVAITASATASRVSARGNDYYSDLDDFSLAAREQDYGYLDEELFLQTRDLDHELGQDSILSYRSPSAEPIIPLLAGMAVSGAVKAGTAAAAKIAAKGGAKKVAKSIATKIGHAFKAGGREAGRGAANHAGGAAAQRVQGRDIDEEELVLSARDIEMLEFLVRRELVNEEWEGY